ncbi:MAG: hypothetical protein KAU21_03965, partial [Gammaproteobacteria bacterium]|nr:hypothetical protein [Gammaproteobacteria bacterium]
ATLFPAKASASKGDSQVSISWSEFQKQMIALAAAEESGSIEQKIVSEQGMQYLRRLDISSREFRQAVNDSYETGNRYWLWQRMIKARNINGGILNIDSDQLVQLHDHPGATGMVRIISGEAEVWQYDQLKEKQTTDGQNVAELVRVSHGVLRAGDMAILTPSKGNIHALRAVSKECRMLDFFIPPYERSQRSWYEPITNNWFNKKQILCRKVPQYAYTKA